MVTSGGAVVEAVEIFLSVSSIELASGLVLTTGVLVVLSLALFKMLLNNGDSVLSESGVLGVVVNLGRGLKKGLIEGRPLSLVRLVVVDEASGASVVVADSSSTVSSSESSEVSGGDEVVVVAASVLRPLLGNLAVGLRLLGNS